MLIKTMLSHQYINRDRSNFSFRILLLKVSDSHAPMILYISRHIFKTYAINGKENIKNIYKGNK